MIKYTTLLSLLCLQAVAMQPADLAKQETIEKMLALSQPDYAAKYDEVLSLDLQDMLTTKSLMDYPRDVRVGTSDDEFFNACKKNRIVLGELAQIKAYAPLLPLLFNKWQGLNKHWVAESMLYHAVQSDQLENTALLLAQGIDPNKPAQDFFYGGTHTLTNPIAEYAIDNRFTTSGPKMRVMNAVMAVSVKNDMQQGIKYLNQAICNYMEFGSTYLAVIECLLANGADPFGKQQDEKKMTVFQFMMEPLDRAYTGTGQLLQRPDVSILDQRSDELFGFFSKWIGRK